MTGPSSDPETNSIRLVFEYRGDDIRLVHQTPVDIAPPPSPPGDAALDGEYVEVRSATDEPLGRAAVHPRISSSAEVFPETPGDPISRVELPEPQGAFTVVVPAPDSADHVSVLRVRPDRSARGQNVPPGSPPPAPPESEEIATFPLGPR